MGAGGGGRKKERVGSKIRCAEGFHAFCFRLSAKGNWRQGGRLASDKRKVMGK